MIDFGIRAGQRADSLDGRSTRLDQRKVWSVPTVSSGTEMA
jgi:hypothetical protein